MGTPAPFGATGTGNEPRGGHEFDFARCSQDKRAPRMSTHPRRDDEDIPVGLQPDRAPQPSETRGSVTDLTRFCREEPDDAPESLLGRCRDAGHCPVAPHREVLLAPTHRPSGTRFPCPTPHPVGWNSRYRLREVLPWTRPPADDHQHLYPQVSPRPHAGGRLLGVPTKRPGETSVAAPARPGAGF